MGEALWLLFSPRLSVLDVMAEGEGSKPDDQTDKEEEGKDTKPEWSDGDKVEKEQQDTKSAVCSEGSESGNNGRINKTGGGEHSKQDANEAKEQIAEGEGSLSDASVEKGIKGTEGETSKPDPNDQLQKKTKDEGQDAKDEKDMAVGGGSTQTPDEKEKNLHTMCALQGIAEERLLKAIEQDPSQVRLSQIH